MRQGQNGRNNAHLGRKIKIIFGADFFRAVFLCLKSEIVNFWFWALTRIGRIWYINSKENGRNDKTTKKAISLILTVLCLLQLAACRKVPNTDDIYAVIPQTTSGPTLKNVTAEIEDLDESIFNRNIKLYKA